jgi:FkbH-like protein
LHALAAIDPPGTLEWIASITDSELEALDSAVLREVLSSCLDRSPPVRAASDATRLARVLGRRNVVAIPASVGRVLGEVPTSFWNDDLAAILADQLSRSRREPALLATAAMRSRESGDAAGAHALLTRWGLADTTLAVVTRIQAQRKLLGPATGQPVRVAVLGSFTLDQLVPFADLELRRQGFSPEFYVAPFNSWDREVLDPASGLRRFGPDVTFLAVSLDDLIPELIGGATPDALAGTGPDAIERIVVAAERYHGWAGKPLVVHSLQSAFAGPLGVLEGRVGPSRAAWVNTLNASLTERLRGLPLTFALDLHELSARADAGRDDPKLRHLASMRLPPSLLPELARAWGRFVAAAMGRTRKCVVVDLDNTLWGGVVGEDGPGGIRLGNPGPGSEFVEFQHYLATLAQRGILLAVASKNNPEDALEVIRKHESMVLRENAFSSIRCNWRPKPENLAAIAEELNIGLDSLVFVDDNPDEREMMRQLLPQVLTVEMPRDPSRFRATLESLPELQALTITEEDKARVGLYRAQREREAVKVSTGTLEEYLASLDVGVRIGPIDEAALSRVSQLFQRTNQFNITTRRHDSAVLQALLADPAWRTYTLRAGDRFGDHGLVAVALVQASGEAWRVESFLMSCRVIGYGIETALLASITNDATVAGAARLEGEFIATKKNPPARDVWARHGFSAGAPDSAGLELWTYDLAATGPIPFPSWIRRTAP